MNTRAWHALARGAAGEAERDAERSLAAFAELGDPWGQMLAVESLAAAAEATGRYDRATALFRRSLDIVEQLGLGAEIPFKLCGLADVLLATGEHAQAAPLYERARRLAAEQSLRLAETYARIGLGRVARHTGRLDTADAHLSVVLEWHRRHGYEPGVAAAILTEFGLVARRRGHASRAHALHEEAVRAARGGGDPRALARAMEALAGTLADLGEHTRAARLLGTAAAARTEAGVSQSPADRPEAEQTAATLRTILGDEAYATEHARGATGPR
ncbi:tetratricopeptide repeat protein [Nonomuraea antimicrobica]